MQSRVHPCSGVLCCQFPGLSQTHSYHQPKEQEDGLLGQSLDSDPRLLLCWLLGKQWFQ